MVKYTQGMCFEDTSTKGYSYIVVYYTHKVKKILEYFIKIVQKIHRGVLVMGKDNESLQKININDIVAKSFDTDLNRIDWNETLRKSHNELKKLEKSKPNKDIYLLLINKEEGSDAMKKFCAERLKMFRNYFNLSQTLFSEITGMSRSVIANCESGKSFLTYANLIESNVAFNKYIEDNDLQVNKDCFVSVMTGLYGLSSIFKEPKKVRYTHSLENFSIAKQFKQYAENATDFEKEKLYNTYLKLSEADKFKIMERMEYIISTYEDESAIPTKRIALLGQTACGNPIEAIAIADEFIETQDLRATFALRAVGDSMAPIINDGDIILIKQTEELEINDIGIFQINESGFSDDEEVTCKRYSSVTADGVITLSPLNAAYEPIVVDSKKEQIKIIGKYLGKA
jgi:SOS-response transcriptional repressor LexA/DNA-binding transcriptional regulator YiaG